MKQAVFYLKQHTLLIQTEKQVVKRVDLSEFVKDKALEDRDAFQLYLKDELRDCLKKIDSVVLILGSGLLSQKAIEKGEDAEAAKDELLATIPYSKESIQEKVIETPAKNYLLLTNKDFYSAVVEVLASFDVQTLAVLPLSLFSDDAEEELSKDEVKTVLQKEELYETGNFLANDRSGEELEELDLKKDLLLDKDDSAVTDRLPYETISIWNKSRLLLILGFLIVLTALLGGLIFIQSTHQNLLTLTKPTPTPTEAPTPTPTPEDVAKSNLKGEIRNGTGTPGQAATVKGLLAGIEYENVTTGNADNTDHTQTEIVFSPRVSQAQQKEIKEVLLKSFEAVTSRVDQSATVDIIVTTGTEK